MNVFNNKVLRSPDDGAVQGEQGGEGNSPSTITSSSSTDPAVKGPAPKIKVGDREYTSEEASLLLSQAQAAVATKKAASLLFDGSKTAEEREQGARQLLSEIGYKKADIDQWVNTNIRPSLGRQGSHADDPAQGGPSETELLRNDVKETRNAQLKGHYSVTVKQALDSDKRLVKIRTAAKRLLPEDSFTKWNDKVGEALQREAKSRLTERLSRSGERMTEDMISQEIDRAAEYVSELMSAGIADPSGISRAADTATFVNPYKGANKPKAPKFEEGGSQGSLEDQATKWMTAELLDMAENSGGTQIL